MTAAFQPNTNTYTTKRLPRLPFLQGCLDVFLNILPTYEDDVRDLCSLAMRCLAGKEELLLDLIMQPRSVA